VGVPASGADVTATGTYVYAIRDGRIAESWLNYDAMGIMRQIGGLDEPAAKSA
jgi:predicted ester cyclase